MNRSVALGSFLGLVLTGVIGYYLYSSKVVVTAPSPNTQATQNADIVEPPNLPYAEIADNFTIDLPGRENLIAHIASIFPRLSPEQWDTALSSESKAQRSLRSTIACTAFEPEQAIFLSESRMAAVLSGKQTVLVVMPPIPKCFLLQSTVNLVYDDMLKNRIAYRFGGTATVERILEEPIESIPEAFLQSLKLSRDEMQAFTTLSNPQSSSLRSPVVILLKATSEVQPMEPQKIPPFAAGASVIQSSTFKTILEKGFYDGSVLLDVRGYDYRTNALPNSELLKKLDYVSAPFKQARPEQLKFRIDFPYEFLLGSSFDFAKLPVSTDSALFLIGNDEQDPTPLWALRELRAMGRRRVIIVRDGVAGLARDLH